MPELWNFSSEPPREKPIAENIVRGMAGPVAEVIAKIEASNAPPEEKAVLIARLKRLGYAGVKLTSQGFGHTDRLIENTTIIKLY